MQYSPNLVNTRGRLLPNPEEDSIQSIFWCLQTPSYASASVRSNSKLQQPSAFLINRIRSGIITMKDKFSRSLHRSFGEQSIDEEDSELDIINRLVDVVRELDPDILTGYEVQSSSWGYVIERARMQFGNFLLGQN